MNSGFGDFLSQLPSGLIVTFCLFGTILIVALALIFRERLGIGAGKSAQGSGLWSNLTSAVDPPEAPVEHELPDLDLLVDTSTLAASKPAAVGRSGSVYKVTLSTGREVQVAEVMTLLRGVNDGRLIIHIGEQAYRSGDRITNQEFVEHLESALAELQTLVANIEATSEPEPQVKATPEIETPVMIEQGPMEEPKLETFAPSEVVEISEVAPTAPSAEPLQESILEETAPPPVTSSKPTSDKPASSKPAAKGKELPGDLPKFESTTPLKPRKNLFERTPKPDPIPELDIAGAIETFLQYKLGHTPEYAERSIHVHPSPTGGVMIEVDGVYYESVGDVSDQQVREFLSNTIQEWQDRQ